MAGQLSPTSSLQKRLTIQLPNLLLGSPKVCDHRTRPLLIELEELLEVDDMSEDDQREWKETSRWIKYEEDVEMAANRWGKPHVAVLSFHALLHIRKLLQGGLSLLDMDADGMADVSRKLVEALDKDGYLGVQGGKSEVARVLALRHKHLSIDQGKRTFRNRFGFRKAVLKPDLQPPPEGRELPTNAENFCGRIPPNCQAASILVAGGIDFLDKPFLAFVRLGEGVPMPNVTEVPIPVRFVTLLMGPPQEDIDYHELGRSMGTLMSSKSVRDVMFKTDNAQEDLLGAFNEFLDDSIVVPPGEWDSATLMPVAEMKAKVAAIRDRKRVRIKKMATKAVASGEWLTQMPAFRPRDPLQPSGFLFGGVINDIRQRYPLYLSDFKDSMNLVSLAGVVFIFFTCAPISITYGGIIAEKTGFWMGISETLLSTSVAGIVFALLAGQPLIIVGTTGPLLLFDEALYRFCQNNRIQFLPVRVWIGIWIGIIGLFMAMLDGSLLVSMFSRFVQEIFSALISVLFIWETIHSLHVIFQNNPLKSQYCNQTCNSTDPDFQLLLCDQLSAIQGQPNTALLCTILTLGTFFIAYCLKYFRNSHFLSRFARRALGDFGVPIAILFMSIIAHMVPDTCTPKLQVPHVLEPTSPARGWFISPVQELEKDKEIWEPKMLFFISCVPAFLAYIIIFMETQICELIFSKREMKLRKGAGIHLDVFLLSLFNVGCGFFGAPWMCTATIRSASHVSALSVWTQATAPGEAPKFRGVKEQRVTGLLLSVMIGVAAVMTDFLRPIPVAVVFGVYLYMGVASMSGIQLFDRIPLLFMPSSIHPELSYVQNVRTWKMHLFTMLQLSCLMVLFVIHVTEVATLSFPFLLLLLVPLRAQFNCCFSEAELEALDADEAEDEDDPDFFTLAHKPGGRRTTSRSRQTVEFMEDESRRSSSTDVPRVVVTSADNSQLSVMSDHLLTTKGNKSGNQDYPKRLVPRSASQTFIMANSTNKK